MKINVPGPTLSGHDWSQVFVKTGEQFLVSLRSGFDPLGVKWFNSTTLESSWTAHATPRVPDQLPVTTRFESWCSLYHMYCLLPIMSKWPKTFVSLVTEHFSWSLGTIQMFQSKYETSLCVFWSTVLSLNPPFIKTFYPKENVFVTPAVPKLLWLLSCFCTSCTKH